MLTGNVTFLAKNIRLYSRLDVPTVNDPRTFTWSWFVLSWLERAPRTDDDAETEFCSSRRLPG